MSYTLFDMMWRVVTEKEGAYSNDPKDPGGETIFGVSKVYHPSVKDRSTAKKIMFNSYFLKYRVAEFCYSCGFKTGLAYFLAVINLPSDEVIKAIQLYMFSCGTDLKVDGIVGSKTLSVLKENPISFNDLRLILNGIYATKNNLEKYGKGWVNRYVL